MKTDVVVSGLKCLFRDGFLIQLGGYHRTDDEVLKLRGGTRSMKEVEGFMLLAEQHPKKFIGRDDERLLPIYRTVDPKTY